MAFVVATSKLFYLRSSVEEEQIEIQDQIAVAEKCHLRPDRPRKTEISGSNASLDRFGRDEDAHGFAQFDDEGVLGEAAPAPQRRRRQLAVGDVEHQAHLDVARLRPHLQQSTPPSQPGSLPTRRST